MPDCLFKIPDAADSLPGLPFLHITDMEPWIAVVHYGFVCAWRTVSPIRRDLTVDGQI